MEARRKFVRNFSNQSIPNCLTGQRNCAESSRDRSIIPKEERQKLKCSFLNFGNNFFL